jgi:pimeloyl-ACP methyl ester carboxylesterase
VTVRADEPGAAAIPPILLLHGQPGSRHDWDAVRVGIAGAARVVAVDRPGWEGLQERRPLSRPGGLALSAAAAVAALDRAGIERAVVAGHSFGGGVAAWMAAHHRERVAALVLVAPAANSDCLDGLDRLLAMPGIGYGLSAAMLGTTGLVLSSRWIRRNLSERLGVPEAYLRANARQLRRHRARHAFWVEQRSLLEDLPALEARLKEIRVPTTILVGSADTTVPPSAARRLARQIPGARLLEVPGAHHILCAAHPELVARELVRCARAAGSARPEEGGAREPARAGGPG